MIEEEDGRLKHKTMSVDPFILEDVSMLLKSMVNGLSKSKQV